MTDDSTMTTSESFVDVAAPVPEPPEAGTAPKDALTLTVLPKHETIGVSANMSTTQICAHIEASDLQDDDNARAPVDIMVALDTSASMQGNKLELCKRTLHLLIRSLHSKDRFGLVRYGSQAHLAFPLHDMTAANKEAAIKAIDALRISGQTNMSAAIGLAFQEMYAAEKPNAVRSIFLLTDGHANIGIGHTEGLVELTRNCYSHNYDAPVASSSHSSVGSLDNRFVQVDLASSKTQDDDGVAKMDSKPPAAIAIPSSPAAGPRASLFCFGYGTDHNTSLLECLADVTEGGSYHFVQDDTDVGSAFGDALGGILSMVAQSAVLTIQVPKFSPSSGNNDYGIKIEGVSHEGAVRRENGSYAVSIGDFYAEESRDVIIDVALANPDRDAAAAGPIPHLKVSLSYTDVVQRKPIQTSEVTGSISRPFGSTEIAEANAHVEAQCLRLHAARELRLAAEEAGHKDFEGAKRRVNNLKGFMRVRHSAVQETITFQQLTRDAEVVDRAISDRPTYAAVGSRRVAQKSKAMRCQRSAAPMYSEPEPLPMVSCSVSKRSAPVPDAYQSRRRAQMTAAFQTTKK